QGCWLPRFRNFDLEVKTGISRPDFGVFILRSFGGSFTTDVRISNFRCDMQFQESHSNRITQTKFEVPSGLATVGLSVQNSTVRIYNTNFTSLATNPNISVRAMYISNGSIATFARIASGAEPYTTGFFGRFTNDV